MSLKAKICKAMSGGLLPIKPNPKLTTNAMFYKKTPSLLMLT